MRPNPRSGVYYGWWIVAALFVMLSFSSGLGFYMQSVLLEALADERGLSVRAASGATALCFLTMGFTGLGVARLLERHDVRWIIAVGSSIAAVALYGIGRVTELWQIYAVYTVFGAGFSASSLIPGTTLIARWFDRHRSVALSIASTGLSVGGIGWSGSRERQASRTATL